MRYHNLANRENTVQMNQNPFGGLRPFFRILKMISAISGPNEPKPLRGIETADTVVPERKESMVQMNQNPFGGLRRSVLFGFGFGFVQMNQNPFGGLRFL